MTDFGFDVEKRQSFYFLLIDFWSDCGFLLMMETQSLYESLADAKIYLEFKTQLVK